MLASHATRVSIVLFAVAGLSVALAAGLPESPPRGDARPVSAPSATRRPELNVPIRPRAVPPAPARAPEPTAVALTESWTEPAPPVDPALEHEIWLGEIAAARAAVHLRLDEDPAFARAEAERRAPRSAEGRNAESEEARTRALASSLIEEFLARKRDGGGEVADGSDPETLRMLVRSNAREQIAQANPTTRLKLLEWSLAALD